MKISSVKSLLFIFCIMIMLSLRGTPDEKRRTSLIVLDQKSRSQAGAAFIKDYFRRLLTHGNVYIRPEVDQSALVENIKKYVTHFGADLATKVSFNRLEVHKCDVSQWHQSLYYYLMVCLAPNLKKEAAEALCLVCSEWFEKQASNVREGIINEINSYGQTALYAAIDFHSRSPSLGPVVHCLAKTGIDPLVKAKEAYTPQADGTSSLDLLKNCEDPVRRHALMSAFDAGRKAGGLKTYVELVAPSQDEGSSQGGTSRNGPSGDAPALDAVKGSVGFLQGTQNALIGATIVVGLVGLFHGVRYVMKNDDKRAAPQHNDVQTGDVVIA